MNVMEKYRKKQKLKEKEKKKHKFHNKYQMQFKNKKQQHQVQEKENDDDEFKISESKDPFIMSTQIMDLDYCSEIKKRNLTNISQQQALDLKDQDQKQQIKQVKKEREQPIYQNPSIIQQKPHLTHQIIDVRQQKQTFIPSSIRNKIQQSKENDVKEKQENQKDLLQQFYNEINK